MEHAHFDSNDTVKDDIDVFSTEIDEDTLEAARKRQIEQQTPSIFKTENWDPIQSSSFTLHQVVKDRASEHLEKGLRYKEKENYDHAITAFNKAINLNSTDAYLYVQRGECYIQLCDFQSAILNYKKVCVLEPNNFKCYARLAFIYFFQGQCLFDQMLFPEALEAFSRAAEMRPEVIGYHTRSMACLAALSRHGECLALVNKRLETETGNADLYVMRARLHDLFKNTTLCYYDVKDALALEPEHLEALKMMDKLKEQARDMRTQAMQFSLVHRHRDALHKISSAIETDPSQPDYHVSRGALQRRLGDYNAAIDDYLLALDKTDHNESSTTYIEAQRQLLLTYNDFAVECFSKGFYEEAIILLNKAIKGEKTEKGLYVNRGDCFFRQANYEFSLADYQQALEIDEADTAIHSRIAVIHNEYGVLDYQDKNYQEAEARFTLASQHNPRLAAYYISRCRARQMMENISGARQDLLVALHLDPSGEDITSLMACLFPGKSVRDVLRSEAAEAAKQALENTSNTTTSLSFKPVRKSSSKCESDEPSSYRLKIESVDVSDNPPALVIWKSGQKLPSLRACLQEHHFNIKIVAGKRQVNEQIKDRLHNRKSLSHGNVRLRPLPEPVAYAKVGGKAFDQKKLAVNVVGQPKGSGGWKKFSLGIGLGDNE